MNHTLTYPIGTLGEKWGETEKKIWLAEQTIKRSYQEDVLEKLDALNTDFDVEQYGELSYNTAKYPLFVIKSRNWDPDKKTILVTGGVHGYETSGVQGAIRFIETKAKHYSEHVNIVVAPCVSPWGYETINRWNTNAIDPNRSFYANSPAEESAALITFIEKLNVEMQSDIVLHIDLHETTDTDNSTFRPALAARDAEHHDNWSIPDGFYLVGDTLKPEPAFQKAIIDAVEKVTHIAPADENDQLIGVPIEQWGVINYAGRALGLCMGLTDASFVTTTEVYPDSPKADDESCIIAQVVAITSGLDYFLNQAN